MKCINCGTDNNLKDRTANQGRCQKCNHPFAFEPTTMDNKVKITDPLFAKAIIDISAKNTLFFTPKQLLYFLDGIVRAKSFQIKGLIFLYLFFNIWFTGFFGGFSSMIFAAIASALNLKLPMEVSIVTLFSIINLIYQFWVINLLFKGTNSKEFNKASRKASAKALQVLGGFILILGISISLLTDSFFLFIMFVTTGIFSIYLGTQQSSKTAITQELLISQTQLQNWLDKWQQINGLSPKILPSPREELAPITINPDVTAYSFDRLVVCDSSTIAQFLIANNFHFENNCAILSINGYPQSIFSTTMEMLRRNPDLKVYAIHDCSPKGISLVNHLRTSSNWFFNSNVTIIDLGLLPRQIIASKRGMFIQSSGQSENEAKKLSVDIRQSLTAEELTWLDSGNFVELESFTPQRLIQVLRSGIISASYNFAIDNSSIILIGDSGNDIYMVESFG